MDELLFNLLSQQSLSCMDVGRLQIRQILHGVREVVLREDHVGDAVTRTERVMHPGSYGSDQSKGSGSCPVAVVSRPQTMCP